MHKNATKCNETLSKWCKNKHGASKIMDTLETYQLRRALKGWHINYEGEYRREKKSLLEKLDALDKKE
jgi:hypothetical protein